MITEIDILYECHSCDFTCYSDKKPTWLLCIVAYHHEIVVELGEYSFDTFSEAFISPGGGSPIFLIQPIGNLRRNIRSIEELLLHMCTEISLVSKHHAIMIFPLQIFEIMKVVNTYRCHIVRMNHASYSADGIEFITIIMHSLWNTIAPIRCSVRIVLPHDASFSSCVPANLYRFGINIKDIFGPVNRNCYIFADFSSFSWGA